ncbi:MAG TPA: tRNA (guanosine(46)-N7)-methyltransferase TrmB [Flavobacteriales bacterium]|nr:tRNA (guanosine(46)-N7)-methyltransferase TrmB [Flavobacteriales bacterium]
MAKNKLRKFSQMAEYPNVFQPTFEELKSGFSIQGKWKPEVFKNDNPLVVELGCGKGEYSVGLAKKYPEKNFLGIDVKGARMWKGASDAVHECISNVAFLRTRIEFIEYCFANSEVDEIWITFPDPQIKKKRAKNRLTHPVFLERYSNILQDKGLIHLKTDSQFLHGYTLGIIEGHQHHLEDAEHDIYNAVLQRDNMEIKTHYEQLFLEKNMPITYLRFRLKS